MDSLFSLVIIKPCGVECGFIGDTISRIEKVGLNVIGMKFFDGDSNERANAVADMCKQYMCKDYYSELSSQLMVGRMVVLVVHAPKKTLELSISVRDYINAKYSSGSSIANQIVYCSSSGDISYWFDDMDLSSRRSH